MYQTNSSSTYSSLHSLSLYSLSIISQAVVSSAKKAVCEMLCRWALLEGELGSFLDTAMDSEVMTDY